MSSLVIKNLPDALHARLKARAARNHRSLTKEAIALLEAAVEAPAEPRGNADDSLDAVFAAGDVLAAQGVDFTAWAATSRDVWR